MVARTLVTSLDMSVVTRAFAVAVVAVAMAVVVRVVSRWWWLLRGWLGRRLGDWF